MKRIAHLMVALAAAVWIVHDLGAPARPPAEPAAKPVPTRLTRVAQNENAADPTAELEPATAFSHPYHPITAPGLEREAVVVAQIEDRPTTAPATAAKPLLSWKLLVSVAESLEPAILPALLPTSAHESGAQQPEHAKLDPALPAIVTPVLVAPKAELPQVDAEARTEAKAQRHLPPVWTSEQLDAASRWATASVTVPQDTLVSVVQAMTAEVSLDCAAFERDAQLGEQLIAQQVEALQKTQKTVAESEPTLGPISTHTSITPVHPLPAELLPLRDKVHQALALYRHDRLLNTANQSPWEIMHRIVAYGIPTEIHRDGPTGEKVNAIGWLLWGGRAAGVPLLVLNGNRPTVVVGPGLQGHPGQFLGMLAQSRVSPETPFRLGGKSLTVRDLIEEEKLTCEAQTELTFKLIALSYYRRSDEEWTAQDGETWSLSRLVQEEIRAPIRGAACGGSHRLFGLSSAIKRRTRDGLPVDGQFRRAQTFIRDYQRYTLGTLENRDGSFSTDWFTRPADSGDPARKMQTTGHILEWLVFSLDHDQLRDPRVVRSVDYIATQLVNNPDRDWSVGPLGHALHALALYDERLLSQSEDSSDFLGRSAPARTDSPKVAAGTAQPAAPAAKAAPSGEQGANASQVASPIRNTTIR